MDIGPYRIASLTTLSHLRHNSTVIWRQDVLWAEGLVGAVLGFQDDGAGGEGVDGVPLACGDVQGDGGAVGREFDRFNEGAGC